MSYKIWIVATKEVSSLFKVIWAEINEVNSKDEAIKKLLKLKKERQIEWDDSSPLKYWIIFTTEDFLLDVSKDDYNRLTSWALPAVIAIPSHKWSTWYWEEKIRKIVEQAVWSDIFWDK